MAPFAKIPQDEDNSSRFPFQTKDNSLHMP